MICISPSLLASDMSRLADETIEMAKAGAGMIHLDVMDGIFVPNITFGPPVIKCLKPKTEIFFDTHLMIEHPQKYIDDFIDAGSDGITIHLESSCNVDETIEYIKSRGKKAGIAIKPSTPFDELFPFIHKANMVLIMTVEPGFGGQSFMDSMLTKVTKTREYIKNNNLKVDIQVDGGINLETGLKSATAGANVIVAGSFLFNEKHYKTGVKTLHDTCKKGFERWAYE